MKHPFVYPEPINSACLCCVPPVFHQSPYFWPSNCWEPENTDYGESQTVCHFLRRFNPELQTRLAPWICCCPPVRCLSPEVFSDVTLSPQADRLPKLSGLFHKASEAVPFQRVQIKAFKSARSYCHGTSVTMVTLQATSPGHVIVIAS